VQSTSLSFSCTEHTQQEACMARKASLAQSDNVSFSCTEDTQQEACMTSFGTKK